MVTKNLQHQLSLLIIRASMKAKYDLMDTAERNNITTMQALTLCLIDKDKPVPMKNISEFMSCDPSNITSLVEQLVSEGFVQRKEASYDRRVKTLSLTNKGQDLQNKLLDITIKTRLPNICNLSEAEVGKLVSVLEKATGMCVTNNLSLVADPV